MLHYEPKDLSVKEVHRLLIGGIGTRPIVLVSTLSENGILNLSPFSFFNVFEAILPLLHFLLQGERRINHLNILITLRDHLSRWNASSLKSVKAGALQIFQFVRY